MTDDDQSMKVCIAPNWEQNAVMLCVVLRDGTLKGQSDAQAEIIRMGQLLDQMGAQRSS
ncbi:hypothetical protein [Paracoccus hibiscisoli]|uniref:hypothetical protein n=1 Tax=Paracoccus hibiscisoli TaxID=2023261 RepID=UPI00145F72BB|nr:hypothetical protein [Paracoccus hibiscisoli]